MNTNIQQPEEMAAAVPQGEASPAPVAMEGNPLASIENGDQVNRTASVAPASATTARTSTPVRTTAPAVEAASRATSAHPEPNVGFPMPTEPVAHGHPTRQYLNAKVTGHLLEGMKVIAVQKPEDPLRVLGEYLIEQSKKIEGSGSGAAALA